MKVLVAAAVVLVGCASDDSSGPGSSVQIALVEPSVVVVRGESTRVDVSVVTSSRSLRIVLDGLPEGVAAEPVTWSPGGSAMVTLTVSAATDAPDAEVTCDISATDGARIVGSTTGRLAVSEVDGSLDPSFGEGGLAFLSPNSTGLGLALEADGGWLVGGSVGGSSIFLSRLLASGALDTSFGSGGTITLAPAVGFPVAQVLSMTTSADGHVAFGVRGDTADLGAVVVLDSNAQSTSAIPTSIWPVYLASDGGAFFVGDGSTLEHVDASDQKLDAPASNAFAARAVGAGTALVVGSDADHVIVAKWGSTPALALDASYGAAGVASVPRLQTIASAIDVDSNGRALAGFSAASQGIGVARLLANGTLDATYGAGGFATLPDCDKVVWVGSLPAGDALVVGNCGNGAIGITRFDPSGAVAAFGTYGRTKTTFGGANVLPTSGAVDAARGRACVTGGIDSVRSFVACYRLTP